MNEQINSKDIVFLLKKISQKLGGNKTAEIIIQDDGSGNVSSWEFGRYSGDDETLFHFKTIGEFVDKSIAYISKSEKVMDLKINNLDEEEKEIPINIGNIVLKTLDGTVDTTKVIVRTSRGNLVDITGCVQSIDDFMICAGEVATVTVTFNLKGDKG